MPVGANQQQQELCGQNWDKAVRQGEPTHHAVPGCRASAYPDPNPNRGLAVVVRQQGVVS